MADTLKAQHTARLTTGHVCYSDMGRVLVSIVADTCGWHDPIGGISNAALVMAKYGQAATRSTATPSTATGATASCRAGQVRAGRARPGRERQLLQQGRRRTRRATCASCPATRGAGDLVDLRAEMDVLVVLSTCPHPLDPDTRWRPRPVGLTVRRSDPPGADDALSDVVPGERGAASSTPSICSWAV